ncbi:MAG: homocysteine S-methyltransferase family protein [Akkermansiaceae bacterium]|nr:homocysteine S-methyltransferase family protein [Akkermansiaceae bacterium]
MPAPDRGAEARCFAANRKDLLNNGDILSLTRPDTIGDIHRRFLEAGSDIIETNTFSATTLAESEFFVATTCAELRQGAARINPGVFRAGSVRKRLRDLARELNVDAGNGPTRSPDTAETLPPRAVGLMTSPPPA